MATFRVVAAKAHLGRASGASDGQRQSLRFVIGTEVSPGFRSRSGEIGVDRRWHRLPFPDGRLQPRRGKSPCTKGELEAQSGRALRTCLGLMFGTWIPKAPL